MQTTWLRPGQIAEDLDVTDSTVRRWIGSGQLDAVRLGTGPVARYRVSPEALNRFIRNGSRQETR